MTHTFKTVSETKDRRVIEISVPGDVTDAEVKRALELLKQQNLQNEAIGFNDIITPYRDSFMEYYPDLEPLPQTRDFSRSNIFKNTVVYRPVHYPEALTLWERHENVHWTKEEAPVSKDIECYAFALNDRERSFVTRFMRFFVQSDVNVATGYYRKLLLVVRNNQIVMMYGGNANREATHQFNYGNVIDTLNLPESEYTEFLNHQEMVEKHKFMLDMRVDTIEEFALSLLKMICSEGITLFGSFVTLVSFKERGLMKDLGTIVEWSSRDETLHCMGHVFVWLTLVKDYPEILTDAFKQRVYLMFSKCVELEEKFIDISFEIIGELPNLNKEDLKNYIRYTANRWLLRCGFKMLYPDIDPNVNPIPWVVKVLEGEQHANFFENTATEYGSSGLMSVITYPTVTPMPPLLVFTRDGCSYCDRLKAIIDKYNYPAEIIDLSDFETRQRWFDDNGFFEDQRKLPKVYHRPVPGGPNTNTYLGGCTDFETYIKNRIEVRLVVEPHTIAQDDDLVTEADIDIGSDVPLFGIEGERV